MVLLHHMGKTYGQPPSTWILPPSNLRTPEDQLLALDFDAACLSVGAEAEHRAYEDMKARYAR